MRRCCRGLFSSAVMWGAGLTVGLSVLVPPVIFAWHRLHITIEPVRLSSLVSGATLECAYLPSDIVPGPSEIRLHVRGQHRLVRSLGDLDGSVQLTSADQALEFVRLRTGPSLRFEWSDGPSMTEVVRVDRPFLRSSGDMADGSRLAWLGRPPGRPTGACGLLTPEAFKAGRFREASAHAVVGGYLVERWLLVQADTGDCRVQLVRESVGRNGAYRRKVMKESVPPNLPGTTWNIPGKL